MKTLPKLLLVGATLSFAGIAGPEARAKEAIAINPTSESALLDGRCGGDEWDAATKIDLPAQASLLLMHDAENFYICAKAKPEDYTVLDLYIEQPQTGHLHHFHLSAQMGERVRTEEGWGASATWELQDYAGFWVPFYGVEEREEGEVPIFKRGTHRQVQVMRKKFPGNSWTMMVGVSSVRHEGQSLQMFYPEKATAEDKSTWGKFSFSD